MIKFKCACGKALSVGNELAGKRWKCPGCGRVLFVPGELHTPCEASALGTTPVTEPGSAIRGEERPHRGTRGRWLVNLTIITLLVGGISLAMALYFGGHDQHAEQGTGDVQQPTSQPRQTEPMQAKPKQAMPEPAAQAAYQASEEDQQSFFKRKYDDVLAQLPQLENL